MDVLVDLVEVPEDELLFQKRYYGIGEVSAMFKVNISLIRFWENEFDILKPKKNGKGDRLFRPEDVKSLQLIYHLLREKKYSIAGAKDFLKKNKRNEEAFAMIETLKKTKLFLLDLKANL
ncbi:MAG: MerR family transcriptional regulator [Chitinophagaceae bacterium]|nr:MAG: MerR family transcriptional regulator [Chitinophagaceae bacterium]